MGETGGNREREGGRGREKERERKNGRKSAAKG